MLRHRLWLVLVGYVIVAVALQVGLRLIGASSGVIVAVSLLLALLVGFEAGTLRRFTLRAGAGATSASSSATISKRRSGGSSTHGSTSRGESVRRQRIAAGSGSRASFATRRRRRPQDSSDVLGLFPQPGAPR